ncbi:hypothetical protein, partial [Archangium sp.]|uniref:hypothetical protein n=1 Tax=Archangium sp. TaxID=1872627 RepID=UPI002D59015A
ASTDGAFRSVDGGPGGRLEAMRGDFSMPLALCNPEAGQRVAGSEVWTSSSTWAREWRERDDEHPLGPRKHEGPM